MHILKKRTHVQSLVQAIILFGFALYFVGIILFGSVYRYVHARHIPMLLFSAAVFFMIGIIKLRIYAYPSQGAFSEQRECGGLFSPVIFALALIGMILIPGQVITFSQFSYSDSLASTATQAPALTAPTAERQRIQKPSGSIVMDDNTFAEWLTELYTKPDAWVGKKITARGAVWKDGDFFGKDEFAVARMMMICCAADMQPVGILAQWKDISTLTDGEWVEVTGTLSKQPYKNTFDPLIIVETVTKITAPHNIYIYP